MRHRNLDRRIDRVAARWSRELGVPLRVCSPLVRMGNVMSVPGHRSELLVRPFGLHRRARPFISKVIQHVDTPGLFIDPAALQDVEVRICVEDASFAIGILMVCSDQRIDAIGCARRARPRLK